ncbi:MAG: DUF4249 domain-containing protein [Bacteroidetes bacterium]|nr:DUF4249 domain-containing protein [Bacteroidota bacterium]
MYDPELSTQPAILVIDGLITDEVKEHRIHLSRAVKFDTVSSIQEPGANVYVQDNEGRKYVFSEKKAGFYYSDATDFKPETGNKYTLFITTRDGKSYQSDAQELLPKESFNEVSNKAQIVPYYLYSDDVVKKYVATGAEFSVTQQVDAKQDRYYRYTNTLLVEYISNTEGFVSYCWLKYNSEVYPILSELTNTTPGMVGQKLGFLPLDNTFYRIVDVKRMTSDKPPREVMTYNDLYHFFVNIKQFNLNKNIYSTYKSMNQQLKANQKIFDPVNLQIKGNMKCLSNPEELVLGIFDVSSVSINTYLVDSYPVNGYYLLTKIAPVDFDTITSIGSNPVVQPRTWIY